jgi:hypothetical protein
MVSNYGPHEQLPLQENSDLASKNLASEYF